MKVTVKGRYIGGPIYRPKEKNGKISYSACVVLEPSEAAKVQAAIDDAIKTEFGSKRPAGLQDWGVRTGDDEEFEHSYQQKFINPKSSEDKRPTVLRRHEGDLVETDDIYPGAYVHVSVSAYAYPGDPKKSIKPGASLRLRALLFWKDGDPLDDGFSSSEFEGAESVDSEAFGNTVGSELL